MPTLPKYLAVVRAAVATLLQNSRHVDSLYSVVDIDNVLSTTTDVDGNTTISAKVNATLLLFLCAFAINTDDGFALVYRD
jgi:hypothetical protein